MKSVLIIDDDPVLCHLVSCVLEDHFETIQAHTGRQGLALAAERTPDLVLLDLELPDLDGFELCKSLRTHPATRAIPIVMLTGSIEFEHRIEGLDTGADDYLCKPFETRELLARIRAKVRINKPDSAKSP